MRARSFGVARVLVMVVPLLALLALTPRPAAAADAGEEQSGQPVRVGTEGIYPPFSYKDPDTEQLTGFDIEVMKAVAERIGWAPRFVEAPFDALFPALDSGRIAPVPPTGPRGALAERVSHARSLR